MAPDTPLHVEPRGLALAVVCHKALLMQRRRWARVAALPARAHPELVQRPIDRAVKPRLAREDAEVVVHEVLLEGPRALLLRGPVAVGLRAELGDHDRLVRIAGVQRVQVRRELRAVEDLAARPRIPAEV